MSRRRKKYRKSGYTENRCWYCGVHVREMAQPTKDHQLPKSRGGKGKLNLVLACKPCNQEKADMDVETYRWFLQDKKPLGEHVKFHGESSRSWRASAYRRELEALTFHA